MYRVTETRQVPVTDRDEETTVWFEVDVQLQQPDGTYLSYTVEVRLVSSAYNWMTALWIIVHAYQSPPPSNPLGMRCNPTTPELEVGTYPVAVEQFATGHALQVYAQQEAMTAQR